IRSLERIGSKVKVFRDTQRSERLGPYSKGALRPLLQEHDLPVLVPHRHKIAVIVEVEELVACALFLLSDQIWKLVEAVEMDFELLARSGISLQKLFGDVGIAGRSQQRWAPIEATSDLVGH